MYHMYHDDDSEKISNRIFGMSLFYLLAYCELEFNMCTYGSLSPFFLIYR